MSIILAIEPDRRRAAQLTGMARAHLRAELLVAPTAAQAVDALDGRVPDVLLTAPLLPSHEEAAMADYLRQLGAAAAHVQTLTIPLLAGGSGERDRPVLSAFRRERTSRTEPEGCDPAVFAEQITEYLREAKERREAPAPIVPRIVEPVTEPAAVENTQPARLTNEKLQRLLAASFEETPDDFSDFALEIATPASKPPLVFTERDEPSRVFVAGDGAPDIKLSRSISDDREDVPTYEPDRKVADDVPAALADDGYHAPITGVRLVAVNGGAGSRSKAINVPLAATPAPRRARRAHSAQEEWGFFDPSQCGFPALIAKLDEIASRESDT